MLITKMLNTNDNYTAINSEFNYLNLRKYLFRMYEKGIQDINIFLLISLEKDYYENESLKRIIVDLVKLSNNIVMDFDILDENGKATGKKTEKIKFKVNKISLDVGDVLNRHRWMYRYNEKYMMEHNLKDGEEDKIPEDIKRDIEQRAYEAGKQQGFDWFKNHAIPAINEVLLNNNDSNISLKTMDSYRICGEENGNVNSMDSRLRGNDSSHSVQCHSREGGDRNDNTELNKNCHYHKGWNDNAELNGNCHSREGGNPQKTSKNNTIKLIDKDFQLTSGITEIFKGNEAIPPIEYICYEYWLKHQKYKTIEKALNEVRSLPNSVVERTYDHEVKYYMERLENRGETEEISKFPEMFKKYSKDYLVDETVEHVLMQQEKENNLEFYCLGKTPTHNIVFSGKKANNNAMIQKYLKNELSNIDGINRITIREK